MVLQACRSTQHSHCGTQSLVMWLLWRCVSVWPWRARAVQSTKHDQGSALWLHRSPSPPENSRVGCAARSPSFGTWLVASTDRNNRGKTLHPHAFVDVHPKGGDGWRCQGGHSQLLATRHGAPALAFASRCTVYAASGLCRLVSFCHRTAPGVSMCRGTVPRQAGAAKQCFDTLGGL